MCSTVIRTSKYKISFTVEYGENAGYLEPGNSKEKLLIWSDET